jgi:hypothetical protein
MYDHVGFKKLRWNDERKLDVGAEKNEWYISALLEKPMTCKRHQFLLAYLLKGTSYSKSSISTSECILGS